MGERRPLDEAPKEKGKSIWIYRTARWPAFWSPQLNCWLLQRAEPEFGEATYTEREDPSHD